MGQNAAQNNGGNQGHHGNANLIKSYDTAALQHQRATANLSLGGSGNNFASNPQN